MSEEETLQIQKDGVDPGMNPGQFVGDLTASIQSFFKSSQFTDLVIATEEQEFKVHRVVVCGQSEYFARLYNGKWTETTDATIKLMDDDPRAIEAMIHFMYGFDYDSSGSELGRVSPMIFNIKLYQMADKYFIPQLKKKAKYKFEQIAKTCWEMDDFPIAIAEAYQRTHKHDRDLRELLVKISQEHVVELAENEKFCSALEETTGFAADLALSLSEAVNHKASCAYCRKTWTLSESGARYCPYCSNSSIAPC
ncbi:BTB/POZ protein [Penicillium verhagenii]|uniref:BTB/POZ protein n=1 Tax=Penicillium verhagenii TaxID=1562060 RepID=UPI002545447A|nr:BTB/POZ protein [Penicillium verhagenii]KAJ5938796.1 BTB/POZ protein [Penicillium verhagenii]